MHKTEEELIWESYTNKRVIKEEYDEELAGELWTYYKDGNSISEMAEEFDLDAGDVKDMVKQYAQSLKPDPIKKQFGLDKRHNDRDISINPNKRSDSIDYDFNPDYEEDAIKGKSQVTDVAAKRNRPRFGLTRRDKAGEIR
jgi:hypothetical protein